jgi:hypothetical protein
VVVAVVVADGVARQEPHAAVAVVVQAQDTRFCLLIPNLSAEQKP